MTGTVTLKLETDPAATVTTGAVVHMQRVSERERAEGTPPASGRIDLSLTPDQAVHGREVELEPGRWLLEATLGSGDVVSELIEVEDGAVSELLIPLPDGSPNDRLNWQFGAGNIEGRVALGQLVEQATKIAADADEKYRIRARAMLMARSVKDAARTGANSVVRKLSDWRGQLDPDGTISRVIESVQEEISKRSAPSSPNVDIVVQSVASAGCDGWLALSKPEGHGEPLTPTLGLPEDDLYLYRPAPPSDQSTRRLVNVEWTGRKATLLIPEPWFPIGGGEAVGSELLVRSRPLDRSLQASIAVLDPDFAPISAMMTPAAMPKAAVFVEDLAEQMFRRKSLVSAAAAYVLLSTGRTDGRLLDMIRSYEQDNDGPDALVIAAWRRIRFPIETEKPDLELALRAFHAGPPHFSIGISWLLDALTLLGSQDAGAMACMETVKEVAIKLDTGQTFTAVHHATIPR
ncbi:hypothetical protein ACVWZ6_001632 [Bradyrhizobium sp. GM6.1]